VHELQIKMIMRPSSPIFGIALHHHTIGLLPANTDNNYHWKTSYNAVYVMAAHPTGFGSQDTWRETFRHLMQVEAGELDTGG